MILTVAPFAGAWIEIITQICMTLHMSVAPFAGAWIEIVTLHIPLPCELSLPSRERGLKFVDKLKHIVALGRSLRGSVD